MLPHAVLMLIYDKPINARSWTYYELKCLREVIQLSFSQQNKNIYMISYECKAIQKQRNIKQLYPRHGDIIAHCSFVSDKNVVQSVFIAINTLWTAFLSLTKL